jgi:hypothetical protein
MKKNESTKSLKMKLNRETLRALGTPALSEVAGGFYTIGIWCNTNTTCGSLAC